ncbi:hypothetical protein EPN96_07035 [bacterium]|nr:MAG: hypothetical protein EPN96_07035 [bacterium]
MNFKTLFLLFAFLALALPAFPAEFDNLLEKGEFFNEKGSAYASDAVKTLEQAKEVDPARAKTDARFVAAVAKAYSGVFRYSEAYMAIEELDKAGKGNEKTAALMDFLLNETGAGRLRLINAVPYAGLTGSIEPLNEARLDVSARKAVDKLRQYLSRPRELGPGGLTLMIPEGKYKITFSAPIDDRDTHFVELEIWAGDQLEQRLVSLYPEPKTVKILPGNRTVSFSWPLLEGAASYRLLRKRAATQWEVRYEGDKDAFLDADVPLGETVSYRLYSLDKDGLPLAFADLQAWAMSPVSSAAIAASIESDLTATVSWELPGGTLDRLVLLMKSETEEKTLFDLRGEEIVRAGEVSEGPLTLKPAEQAIKFRIEAWLDGAAAPSALAETILPVPPQVARIEGISEEVQPDRVTIEWSTFPRDALAQGYAIYVTGMKGIIGELVARVDNAHAREFSYVPKVELADNAQLRHFVLPYVGDRFLVMPAEFEASAEKPQIPFEKRARGGRTAIGDIALAWDPYPEATRYIVRVGEKEMIIGEIYLELSGLQTKLMGRESKIRVFALTGDRQEVPILSVDLKYEHYPRE